MARRSAVRMLFYFAACEDLVDYTGWLFWAERGLAALGLEAA